MTGKTTVALIIARGGSRRLPRKNVKMFCGHPLLAWTVAQARVAEHIDVVCMATDDDEISDISKEYGVDYVIRHPVWEESANRTFVYSVNDLQDKKGIYIDAICTMIPTQPLRLPGDIDRLVANYYKVGAHTMVGMAPRRQMIVFKKLTPYACRVAKFSKRGDHMVNTLGAAVRSPGFILNHDGYFADMSVPDLDKAIEDGKTLSELFYTETEEWQCQDTDTAQEFELCELLMQHYILKGKTMEEIYVTT